MLLLFWLLARLFRLLLPFMRLFNRFKVDIEFICVPVGVVGCGVVPLRFRFIRLLINEFIFPALG